MGFAAVLTDLMDTIVVPETILKSLASGVIIQPVVQHVDVSHVICSPLSP